MQDLQNLHHFFRRGGFNHTAPRQKGRGCGTVSCQCCSVRAGGIARCFGLSCLDGNDALAGGGGIGGHRGKITSINNPLDIQAGSGHARVGQQAARHIGKACLCLVADTGHIGDGKTARLHRYIDGNVRGLADDGDTAINSAPAMLVRPEHRPVQIVQHAIAVWPKKRHVARCRDKLLLQVIITSLGESGGETHSPAAAHGCQICRYLDHRMPVDPEKGGIGRRRQICKVAETGNTMNRVTFRMDWPDITFKVRFQTLFDNIFRPPSAKYGNRLRAEQTRQPVHLSRRAGAEDRG